MANADTANTAELEQPPQASGSKRPNKVYAIQMGPTHANVRRLAALMAVFSTERKTSRCRSAPKKPVDMGLNSGIFLVSC